MGIYLRKRVVAQFDPAGWPGLDSPPPMVEGPDRGSPLGGIATGWAVTGTLIAGILVWGGLGYLLDRLTGFRWLFVPIGMVVGMAGGIYLVYLRYGKDDGTKT